LARALSAGLSFWNKGTDSLSKGIRSGKTGKEQGNAPEAAWRWLLVAKIAAE
jgi:hypothetical protein